MPTMNNNDTLVDLVLDLSLESVGSTGLEGFSIRNIANAAGCSVTPIYRRFATKSELLLAVQMYAYGEELKFHKDFTAQLEGMPLDFENMVEVVILYIEKRAKFTVARFGSEVLVKFDPDTFSRELLQHWHQLRLKFWSDLLSAAERVFPAELPGFIATYVVMEELYAYELWPNTHYRMLLSETVRALFACTFGVQDTAAEGKVCLWINKGTDAFPDFDKHQPDDLAEKLLEMAAVEIRKKGVDSLSQRSLTKKAGVSSAMIAYHFGNMANFVNEALWRVLLKDLPRQYNPGVVESVKQKDQVEWVRVLRRLTRPKTKHVKAGFYAEYACLTGQASLLASRQKSLYPLIEHLRRIDGWGTYRSAQTIWPSSLNVERGSASVCSIWLKGQAVLNDALSGPDMIPNAAFYFAAELLFVEP